MAYAIKVPIKKQNLKTYRDFVTSLWKTFQSLSETCSRIDIVFDLYNEQSIKASERSRRNKVKGIETYISGIDQPLPIEIGRFWPISKSKVLQQVFIQWIIEDIANKDFNKQLFLGGSHKEGDTLCFSVCNGAVTAERLLECTHEEADDRVLFHVKHAVKVGRFGSVAIASPETDIFVSATHHFDKLIYTLI